MTLSLLERAASTPIESYDPAHVIRAVNALQPMGKQEALGRLRGCLESRAAGTTATGLFWVTRVLFDVPAELGFPPVSIGTPDVQPPPEPDALPRFPIVIVQDIPLLVVSSYYLRGLPQPVEDHVTWYEANGSIRDRPLRPPSSLAGIEIELLETWSAAYAGARSAPALNAVRAQLSRLAVSSEA